MRTSENSSDLERAPGARSIADEFSVVRMAVQKLKRCENTAFHIRAALLGGRATVVGVQLLCKRTVLLPGSQNAVSQIRGVFLKCDPIHTKK